MNKENSVNIAKGVSIPLVGFGTYLIDNQHVSDAVMSALKCGYRHIDTAEVYENEKGVGEAIAQFQIESSLKRDELFVTTKLWPGNPEWGQVSKSYQSTIESLELSLERLKMRYVDLYLIHAPFGKEARLEQWRALVSLKSQGKIKAIGVSNFSQSHLEEINQVRMPLPQVNQIELHPWSQKPQLREYLREHQILPIAYSSLAPLSTWRSKLGKTVQRLVR